MLSSIFDNEQYVNFFLFVLGFIAFIIIVYIIYSHIVKKQSEKKIVEQNAQMMKTKEKNQEINPILKASQEAVLKAANKKNMENIKSQSEEVEESNEVSDKSDIGFEEEVSEEVESITDNETKMDESDINSHEEELSTETFTNEEDSSEYETVFEEEKNEKTEDSLSDKEPDEDEDEDENELGRYHVLYRKEDKKWYVKREGSARIIRVLETQKEAIAYATIKAINQDTSLVIHKMDGKIRKQAY